MFERTTFFSYELSNHQNLTGNCSYAVRHFEQRRGSKDHVSAGTGKLIWRVGKMLYFLGDFGELKCLQKTPNALKA
eukprot:1140736-Pelagomonas_calceolata.AAC.1